MRFAVRGEPRGPLRFLQPLMRAALRRQFREHCAKPGQVVVRVQPKLTCRATCRKPPTAMRTQVMR